MQHQNTYSISMHMRTYGWQSGKGISWLCQPSLTLCTFVFSDALTKSESARQPGGTSCGKATNCTVTSIRVSPITSHCKVTTCRNQPRALHCTCCVAEVFDNGPRVGIDMPGASAALCRNPRNVSRDKTHRRLLSPSRIRSNSVWSDHS